MSIIPEENEDTVREPSNREEPARADLRERSDSEGSVQEPDSEDVSREPSNKD